MDQHKFDHHSLRASTGTVLTSQKNGSRKPRGGRDLGRSKSVRIVNKSPRKLVARSNSNFKPDSSPKSSPTESNIQLRSSFDPVCGKIWGPAVHVLILFSAARWSECSTSVSFV